MVRYAGLFATRWKARYLQQARVALAQEQPAETTGSAPSMLPWRQRRLATQGKDPLLCWLCQHPMHLVAKIFGNHQVIAEHFEAAGRSLQPYALGWQPDPG